MTHFYATGRPDSGLSLKPQDCVAPAYEADTNAVAQLAWETKLLQKQLAKLIDAIEAESKSSDGTQVDVAKQDEAVEKAAVLEKASQQMTLRLQIASKLVHECKTLEQKLSDCGDYEEERRLRGRLKWLCSRIVNSVDAGLTQCEQATHTIQNMASYDSSKLPNINRSPTFITSREDSEDPIRSKLSSPEDHHNLTRKIQGKVGASGIPPMSAKSVSFQPGAALEGKRGGAERELDIVDLYWLEKHKRYSFHRNTQAMVTQDPNTLHNLGIAVCDSYVDTVDESKQGLPPAPEVFTTMTDFYDFERRALETLDGRVMRICGKVWEGAQLACSTNPPNMPPPVTPSQTSLVSIDHELLGNYSRCSTSVNDADSQQVGGGHHHSRSSGRSMTSSAVSSSLYRQSTPFSVRIERLHEKLLKLGKPTSDATPTVNPKDLPCLPLPIMKRNEVCPRLPTEWVSDVDIGVKNSQPKVVNQHKLYKETELKLFKPVAKSFTGGVEPINLVKSLFDGEQMSSVWSVLPRSDKLKRVTSEADCKALQECVDKLDVSKQASDILNAIATLRGLHVESDQVTSKLTSCMKRSSSGDGTPNKGADNVQTSAAFTLLSYGVWNDDVIQVAVQVLSSGDCDEATKTFWTQELLKSSGSVLEQKRPLTETELKLCHCLDAIVHYTFPQMTSDPPTLFSFNCLLLLAILGSQIDKFKSVVRDVLLRHMIQSKNDIHASQAAEVLVRMLNTREVDILRFCFTQATDSSSWKCRGNALWLIMCLNPNEWLQNKLTSSEDVIEEQEKLYQVLKRCLWDETHPSVRKLSSVALTHLSMRPRAVQDTIRGLESSNDVVRLQSVVSVATLGIKRNSVLKLLTELLEIDQSDYVKLQVLRTLQSFSAVNARVMRLIAGKVNQGGPFGREATKCLKTMKKQSQHLTPATAAN